MFVLIISFSMALVFRPLVLANPTGMSIIIPTSFVLLVNLSSLSISLCLSLTTLSIQCVRQATHLKAKQTAWPRDKGLTARTHVTENLFTVFPQKRERQSGGRRVVMSIQRLSLVHKSDYMTLRLNQELMDSFLRPLQHDGVYEDLECESLKIFQEHLYIYKYMKQNLLL